MKRLAVILIIACLLLLGCGNPVTPASGQQDSEVTVTLPASMVELEDAEALTKEAREKGIKKVVINSDGSVTYKMSRSVHRQLMQELRQDFNEAVEYLKSGGDFPSIRDVKCNPDLTAITLTAWTFSPSSAWASPPCTTSSLTASRPKTSRSPST